jgi:MFS-type transporter involved in bile tolerance (Atg22 family)
LISLGIILDEKIVVKKPIKVIMIIGIIETLSITYSIPIGGAQFPKAYEIDE